MDTSIRWTPRRNGHLELVLAFHYSLYLTLYKTYITLGGNVGQVQKLEINLLNIYNGATCFSLIFLPCFVYSLDENHSVYLGIVSGHTSVRRVHPKLAFQPRLLFDGGFLYSRM